MKPIEQIKGGPVAPKDAVAKRPAFCIMKEKQICGSPMPDGTGTCFIYENDGRLPDAARLVGSISDEDMLGMLTKTDSLRKLVHSIGVTAESENNDVVYFDFQMYGKRDPYASGTTLTMPVPDDGMEHVIVLDEQNWSDDDDIPGQIRFRFGHGGDMGKVTVRFYLNDGYTAPFEEDIHPVDFESEGYRNMIKKSLMNKGNNIRLKKAIEKARAGKDVTLGFIGGSITQGAGATPINTECYAYKIFKGFCDIAGRGYSDNVHYSKAGVGGTPSELGIVRYDRDVTKWGSVEPDVVVVEFAVNDEGDETKGEFFDSLIRKIYNGPGKPAVIILFAVFSNDFNLQERLSPVGFAYDIPMVSTKNSVVEQFYLKAGEGKVVAKNQYFYDCFHPTNIGHTIMADGVINLLKTVDCEAYDEKEVDITSIDAPIGGEFENIIVFDRKDNTVGAVIDAGDFTGYDKQLQAVERDLDLTTTPQFPDNWFYNGEGTGKRFSVDVECSAFVIIYKDSSDIDVGIADVFADGELVRTINPREIGWVHCNAYIVIRGAENKLHHFEVVPKDPSMKFTILGFGVVRN